MEIYIVLGYMQYYPFGDNIQGVFSSYLDALDYAASIESEHENVEIVSKIVD